MNSFNTCVVRVGSPSSRFELAKPICAGAGGTGFLRYFGAAVLFALASCLLAVLPGQASAEIAANVHFASGYVTATAHDNAVRELAKDADVNSGDRVDTSENGRVQMRFTDGGLVSLMPNSTFSVDEYLHEGQSDDDASLVFGLLRGGLRTVTGAIGKVKHDQYELRTPVATLGIRGTEYTAVLRPANTLRVHVGRGKVVITNDRGSLEVPEGRNAVVSLGQAPEFSDKEPHYQATGPRGDRLHVSAPVSQDPNLLVATMNRPPHGLQSFMALPSTTPGTAPAPGPAPEPGPSTGVPPVSPGKPVDPGPVTLGPVLMAGVNPYGGQSGPLFSLPEISIDQQTWESSPVTSSGELTWGTFSNGTGVIDGDPVTLSLNDYLPYVTGGSTPDDNVPTGTLNFSLDGATMAYGGWSGNGELTKFDFGVDLANLGYSLDFALEMQDPTHGTYLANTSGLLDSGSSAADFSFSNSNVTNPSASAYTPCGSDGCTINVRGFLAGTDAGQAGIAYDIEASDDWLRGAAALKR